MTTIILILTAIICALVALICYVIRRVDEVVRVFYPKQSKSARKGAKNATVRK